MSEGLDHCGLRLVVVGGELPVIAKYIYKQVSVVCARLCSVAPVSLGVIYAGTASEAASGHPPALSLGSIWKLQQPRNRLVVLSAITGN